MHEAFFHSIILLAFCVYRKESNVRTFFAGNESCTGKKGKWSRGPGTATTLAWLCGRLCIAHHTVHLVVVGYDNRLAAVWTATIGWLTEYWILMHRKTSTRWIFGTMEQGVPAVSGFHLPVSSQNPHHCLSYEFGSACSASSTPNPATLMHRKLFSNLFVSISCSRRFQLNVHHRSRMLMSILRESNWIKI